MRLIDLTMPLTPNTPVYPGDPAVRVEPLTSVAEDGYLDHLITVDTHNGTHIDAPGHMVADGKMLNQYPLDTFVGTGKVIDVRQEFSVKTVDEVSVEPGDIVLLWTGSDYKDPAYYETSPAIPLEVAEYLAAKKVKMVGIDTGSVDYPPFLVHKKLLSHDILLIENLVNLAALHGHEFTLFALPLNVDVEASPARVIAKISH